MSAVFVQIGQCGNQVGYWFWKEALGILEGYKRKSAVKAEKDLKYGARLTSILTYSGKLPLILLDSEAKPARTFCSSSDLGHFIREENVITDKTGRGGNWAYGYSGGRKGGQRNNELLEAVVERHRKELERSDRFTGTVVFHSLAGGTGSGMGSRFVEEIRTEHPRSAILCIAVAPHSQGESPLQHYNSLLTLSHLQQFADGVVLFNNDSVMEEIMKGSQKAAPARSPCCSLDDMNSYIGGCMANALMPVYTSGKSVEFQDITWDLVTSGCPNPCMKFLTPLYGSNSPSVKTTWDKTVARMVYSSSMNPPSLDAKKRLTTSVVVMVRSTKSNMAEFENITEANLRLKCKKYFSFSLEDPSRYSVLQSTEASFGERKAMSLLCNSSVVSVYVDHVLKKSRAMLTCGAYVHWYRQYGCSDRDFKLATETGDQLMESYSMH